MKNRSMAYLRKRPALFERERLREKSEVEEFFVGISKRLRMLKNLVQRVEEECAAYCVPSFKSKKEIAKKIEVLRYEIAIELAKAKGTMEQFTQKYKESLNHSLVESIGTHFHYTLDGLVGRLHSSLEEIEKEKKTHSPVQSLPSESSSSVEGVYRSVYFISTIIKELKTVILSQTDKIDRLDVAMDTVSLSSEKSTKEIVTLSTFGSHVKNRVITILFLSIFILIVLSAIKASSHR
ncbi:hypothetical protein NEFER03_0308 [Nematocida sp. LUAm3]|nr:hypothetical protein NEFER03_0308 [Nematocida sp. LUAm3]